MGKARSAARGKASAAPAGAWGGRARPNPNPFEVKVNRQKFQVLGRKTRHDVGLPGVSRARALQKVSGEPGPPGAGGRPPRGPLPCLLARTSRAALLSPPTAAARGRRCWFPSARRMGQWYLAPGRTAGRVGRVP